MAYLNTDIPELDGSDTAICLANLDTLGVRKSRVTESMLAMLSELSDAVIHDAEGDPDTVESILLSLQGAPEDASDGSSSVSDRIREQVAEVNRHAIERLSAHSGVYMRLLLYHMIGERLAAREDTEGASPAHADAPSLPENAVGRIAYMSGAFADKAYLRLAAFVPRARAATFHSFVDACEEVRGGLCEYALLPLENTQSGKLTAFSHLIIRYGLCISAVCDLENGAAPGQTTRFALVRAMPEDGLPPRPISPDKRVYLELLHTVNTPSLSELLAAAAFCGLTLTRVDTLPRYEDVPQLAEAGGDTLPICCVFDATEADLATFRRYLSLELSEDILMGLYAPI